MSVCQYRNCLNGGSAEVLAAFQANPIPDVVVSGTGCLGQCSIGPTVRITPDELWYCRVKPEQVPVIVEEHLKHDRPVAAWLNPRFHPNFGGN